MALITHITLIVHLKGQSKAQLPAIRLTIRIFPAIILIIPRLLGRPWKSVAGWSCGRHCEEKGSEAPQTLITRVTKKDQLLLQLILRQLIIIIASILLPTLVLIYLQIIYLTVCPRFLQHIVILDIKLMILRTTRQWHISNLVEENDKKTFTAGRKYGWALQLNIYFKK